MTHETPKTAIIYTRVSSKEQVENTSLDSQEYACRQYATSQGLRVLRVFRELGESAKTAERTEFINAIAYCSKEKGRVGYFVVHNVSRFCRKTFDHQTIRLALSKSGTRLRSVTEQFDESPAGQFLENIMAATAQLDNDVRSQKTAGGMQERIKQGKWVFQCPLGYCRPHGSKDIAPDSKVAPLMRLAFEEYRKGIYTFKAIAEFMAARGLRTQRGKKPRHQQMQKWLKNPLYCGIISVPVWGEPVKGDFEPIVSEKLFADCQHLFSDPAPHAARRHSNNPEFPLRKLAVCATCNQPLTGSTSVSKGKKYPNYHHQRQGCENAKAVRKDVFEEKFVALLNTITPNIKFEALFKEIVIDVWKKKHKKFDEENAIIHRQLQELGQERQRVFDFHRARKYTDDEFQEQKALVDERLRQKYLLLETSRVDELDMGKSLSHCFDFVRHTSKWWLRLAHHYPERKQFQKQVFHGPVAFDGNKFGNPKLSPVYRLNQEFDGKKSQLVAPRGIEPRLPA